MLALTACGGDDSSSNDPATAIVDIQCAADVLTGAPKGGYFTGEIATETSIAYAEALLTEDGEMRLHMDSLGDGILAQQVIGSTQLNSSLSEGELRAEGCSASDPSCIATGAYIQLHSLCGGELVGTIYIDHWWGDQVTTPNGSLNFTLQWPTTTYRSPATLEYAAGTYAEKLAFATAGGAVISVDSTGNAFFQSASTSCVGNGSLNPHLDGAFNVYDVEMTIANCAADFAYLNATLSGLATRSIGDWGDWLVLWLSTPDTLTGSGTNPAITMWGERL
jgi:hypothetical protein